MKTAFRWCAALAVAALVTGCATRSPSSGPLVIQAQGSFAVGGTVQTTPGSYNNNHPSAAGQSLHGDHL